MVYMLQELFYDFKHRATYSFAPTIRQDVEKVHISMQLFLQIDEEFLKRKHALICPLYSDHSAHDIRLVST